MGNIYEYVCILSLNDLGVCSRFSQTKEGMNA